MSANFTLTLSNPNVTTNPPSVVYTNLAGGNTLDLIVGNNFGFDLTIGGASTGRDLAVAISADILGAAGASKLAVAAPWTIAAVQPPDASSDGTGRFWTFSLLPPPGGVSLPNGQSITIVLRTLEPSATGTGLVKVRYQFDDDPADDLNASASLSSLAPPDPKHPPLIGDDEALRLTISVNGGVISNPIMVSATPVTSATAVDNQLQFNLLFQSAPAAIAADGGSLVPGWDPAHPPAFRIFFPYAAAGTTLPAPLDLTDSLSPGDTGYNALTSAWNIHGALDPSDPNITQDKFWEIALDPDAATPVWIVTPTAANTHLFTTVESSPSEPGPFLDLYLDDIVSGLPIDPEHPETIVYVQWNGVPGFNDGVVAYPLRKTTLAVNTFEATLRRSDLGPELTLEWTTSGAASCLVSGNSEPQRPQAQGDSAYRQMITVDNRLLTAYTLTAVGPDGTTTVSRRLVSRWRMNESVAPVPVAGAAPGFHALPDGRSVLVIDNGRIRFFDAETLRPRGGPGIGPPDGSSLLGFAVTEDGTTVYAPTTAGFACGFDVESGALVSSSAANFAGTAFPPFPMALTKGDAAVAFTTSVVTDNDQPYGANQIIVLNAADLQPAAASPVALSSSPFALVTGRQTGRYYVALPDGVAVLDGSTFQPVAGSPVPPAGPFMIATSRDESRVYAVSLPDPVTFVSSVLSTIDASTLRVRAQIGVDVGIFPFISLGKVTTSVDDRLLFVTGLSLTAEKENRAATRMSVYDAETLDEMPWSPVQFGELLSFDLDMAPDGSRVFVLAGKDLGKSNASLYLCAVDPEFT